MSEAEFSGLRNEQNFSVERESRKIAFKPKGTCRLLLFNSGNSNILEILIQTDIVRSRILRIKELTEFFQWRKSRKNAFKV
ncbi:hypothetical protein RCC89_14640 [Cytophagaceae bacterium ABcell3]|nr:hypothetical protein RCC89_14640 [Cytophagaceae bacterium ABcell3]